MSFEMLSSVGYWFAAFLVIAGVALVLAVGAVAKVVATNRPVRIARKQSVPAYYRSLIVNH